MRKNINFEFICMTLKLTFFSLLLFICLFVPVCGTIGWLHMQKKIVKKAVKHHIIEGLDKNELQLVKLTKTEILQKVKWEHSKEFEYKGEMYDIVSQDIVGDTTYFWCWWDKKETALNKKLFSLLQIFIHNSPERNQKTKVLLSFYKSLYCNNLSIHQYNPIKYDVETGWIEMNSVPNNIYLNILGPPPKYNNFM